MRVAFVHDYIKEYGGAERVLEALHEVWPQAPVYTSVYLPQFLGPHRERFAGWDIRTSWLQFVPFRARLISIFRLLAPLAFRSFDLSSFDVVIVSATGAFTPNVVKLKTPASPAGRQNSKLQKPLHICYCHTPPRYLYGYATAREWRKNPFVKVIGEIVNHILRIVDFKSAQNVDYFIANSKEVAARIKKFYRRETTVIYPPVDTAFSSSASSVQLNNKKLNANSLDARRYFLTGGRLARPKHIDLIVQACKELNVPLKVFGKGFAGYGEELEIRNQKSHNSSFIIHNSNIEFLGEVTDEEKFELMRGAKAFLFASEEEDFGITPVEAMAAGTPVIAYRSGGVVESVVDGKTGIFFDELTVESLRKAMERCRDAGIKPEDCVRQAEKFSKERFKKEIGRFVVQAAQQGVV